MSKKVSVIVPIYNVEIYLRQCLESLIHQTYLNLEVIMVDDGSKDNSGKICDEYVKKDKRFRVVHKKNKGLSSARKTGMELVSGSYVMFLDGDDWIDLQTIQNCVEKIERNEQIGCVLFSYAKEVNGKTIPMHVMDTSVELYSAEVKERIYRRLFGLSKDELSHPERMENIVSCCMKLYRVELAREGQYFDTKQVGSCEDGLFNMYALYHCEGAVYIDEPFYHYRKTGNSLTSSYRPQFVEQWECLFDEMMKVIEKYQLDERYIQALDNRIALSITAIGLNELRNLECGAIGHIKKIKKYLKQQKYHTACVNMPKSNLPVVWKILMLCSQYKLACFVYVFLRMIAFAKRRKRN